MSSSTGKVKLVVKVEGIKGVEAVKNELKKQFETKETKSK